MSKWTTKYIEMPTPENFCILPWVHVAINSAGTYRVCCQSDNEMNKILSDEGKPAKAHRHNVKDIWNSDTYRTIRKQFLNNEKPAMCHKCYKEEASGMVSVRIKRTQYDYENQIIDSIRNTTDGNAPLNVKYLDIRLGNLCNLRCRMCNPYSSNQWLKEWHLINEDLNSDTKKLLKNMTWFEEDFLWENLSDIVESVDEIYLTGGEPTLALKQYDLFDSCIEKGVAKDIVLRYNTNLTNIPQKMVDYWKHFKKVKLNCSIDGIGTLNDYIRYPSKWKTIERNWIELSLLRRGDVNLDLGIDVTVQMYNILHLNAVYDYFGPTLGDPIISSYEPYLNILDHPHCLNVKVLPSKLKDEAARRLEPYDNHDKVAELIKYMYSEDWSDKFDEFITYTNALDKNRKEDVLYYIPELKEYWHD